MMDICSFKCCGVDNYHGSCCSVENRDWIIGPIDDSNEFLERVRQRFGIHIQYDDIFMDYHEGKKLFPERSNYQRLASYPALRVNMDSPMKPCIFYNSTIRKCMVYDIRPNTCRNYQCDFLKENKGNE